MYRAAIYLMSWLLAAPGWTAPVYSLAHLTRDNGLPQSSVRALVVDSRGFVWVGTEKGVARYDGYRFKELASPYNSGVVVNLFVDSRDRVWTRWYGKSTTLYDPARNLWQTLAVPDSAEYLGEIAESSDHRIWYSTNERLYTFDETAQRLVKVADVAPEPELWYQQVYAKRLTVFHDAVWVAGYHELVRVALRDNSATRIPVPGKRIQRIWPHENALWMCNEDGVFRVESQTSSWTLVQRSPHPGLTSCLVTPDGSIWMGFANHGAVRVSQGESRSYLPSPGAGHADRTTLASAYVLNVQSDSRGQVWVLTPGVAHRWLGEPQHAFERFEYSPDSESENPGGSAAARLTEDPNGVLWLGSEDHGLGRLSAFARKVQWLAPPSTVNAHVRTPLVDARGDVWLATNQDGVYRWDVSTALWTHHAADANDASRLPTREVRALYATRAGDIWAGSQNGGIISRYDRRHDRWQRFELGTTGLIFNFLELPDGQLLIGRKGGVTLFDPGTRRVQQYEAADSPPIRASLLSRSGHVYLGTHQRGVIEWIPGRGFAREWRESLSDQNVFSLHEDRDGALWIGTWGGGLDRLQPDTGRVQVISTHDGLPDNTIFGILPGKHDDLWVSTNSGLARIQNCIAKPWPCAPTITVLNNRSGLPFSEFDAEAHGLAPDGSLLFGGYQGLIRFDPDRLETNRRPPTPQISAIYLNDRELSAVPDLPHAFGALRIQFSSLDLNAPENSRYRYRLSSGDWLPLNTAPELVLTDLGAGSHLLELQASNADGVWSDKPLTVSFRVAPAWYAGVAAWFTYAVLLILGVFTLIKWRERRLHANAARLEATVAERTRQLADATRARDEFYANVSHEIRTPLALITSTAEQLREHDDRRTQVALVGDLVRHSDRLRRHVESLITVSHLQSSPSVAWMREDVAALLRSLAADLARIAGRTRLLLDLSGDDSFVRSYPNALDTIFSNLLLNALRHTPEGGTVQVTVDAGAEAVVVSIADSGPGIEPHLLPKLFERGVRGEAVAHNALGHGIGLNLVRQTVLALGGTIEARNIEPHGACFVISLLRAGSDLPVASHSRSTPLPEESPHFRPPNKSAGRARGSVLIIEDHDELRAHVAELMAPHYRVREAATAKAGLAEARKFLPDVVICDVMLPDGQGFDVVAALKSDALTDHISVVMLTALADDASRLRGLAHQADLYVTKPFSRDMLRLQVGNLIDQRRRLRRAAAQETWAAKASAAKPVSGAGFEARLLATLEEHFVDPECGVDLLAKQLAMSRKQLERKCRYCFKCSPKVLLNRFRLDKARALLEQDIRVGEVAQRCGFSSQTHFGVLFKKRFGSQPSKMARNHESESQTRELATD